MSKFDEFLTACAEDSINGSSGDWPEPVKGEVAAYAEGLKLEAQDINEGRGPWLGYQKECRTCGRLSLTLEDGECPGCLESDEERIERTKRANAEAAKGLHAQTARHLRLLAQDEGLNPVFRALLLADAERHERKAS